MNDHFAANGRRLNGAVFRMGDYTLRRTDVNDAAERARKQGKGMVMDARLGDPTVFGMTPNGRYMALVEEAIREPRTWSYSEARGLEELREVLGKGNPENGEGGYAIPAERVFLGPGVSGVTRFLFSSMISREAGDNVIIPEWSYIIYFAEAELSQAQVRNAPLSGNGEVDLERLRERIDRRTKAVFLTTVGNPLGIAMRPESIGQLIGIINSKEREYNHPIYLVADTIYEGFRSGSAPVDPIRLSIEHGRLGPTIELYSISKMIGAPGARLGWMRVHHGGGSFDDEIGAFLESLARVFQPSLGTSSNAFQLALLRLYREMAADRSGFEEFRNARRTEAIGRVRRLLTELSRIDGLVFPQYYYRGGALDLDCLNSFYILLGLDKSMRVRNGMSQAREMAEYMIDTPGVPVILATPGDSFLARDLRGREQEFMRIVGLSDNPDMVAGAIASFVRSRK
jgi:aspartate/methionine/tyrosine aminotransferase